MPSYRKRHREPETQTELPPKPTASEEAAAPVASSPTAEPGAVANASPQGEMEDLRKQLSDLQAAQQKHAETAELIRQQMAQPQQPQSADPLEQVIANLPDRAKALFREHPELLNNPRLNAALQHYHWLTVDELNSDEMNDAYFDMMEHRLGLRQPSAQAATNGHEPHNLPPQSNNSHVKIPPIQVSQPPEKTHGRASAGFASEPKPAQPTAQPQYQGPPVSAPPTREVPSMSTGRVSPSRIVLSPQEMEVAIASKPDPAMSDPDALRLYAQNKARFEALKRAGSYPER